MLNGRLTGGHGKGRLQNLGLIFPALAEDVPKHRTCILNTGIFLESQRLHHLLFPFQTQNLSIDTSNIAVSKLLSVNQNNSYFILGK